MKEATDAFDLFLEGFEAMRSGRGWIVHPEVGKRRWLQGWNAAYDIWLEELNKSGPQYLQKPASVVDCIGE